MAHRALALLGVIHAAHSFIRSSLLFKAAGPRICAAGAGRLMSHPKVQLIRATDRFTIAIVHARGPRLKGFSGACAPPAPDMSNMYAGLRGKLAGRQPSETTKAFDESAAGSFSRRAGLVAFAAAIFTAAILGKSRSPCLFRAVAP